jgi:hypothetical protein
MGDTAAGSDLQEVGLRTAGKATAELYENGLEVEAPHNA